MMPKLDDMVAEATRGAQPGSDVMESAPIVCRLIQGVFAMWPKRVVVEYLGDDRLTVSTPMKAVRAVFAVDEAMLRVWSNDASPPLSFLLIHQNGEDVISDGTSVRRFDVLTAYALNDPEMVDDGASEIEALDAAIEAMQEPVVSVTVPRSARVGGAWDTAPVEYLTD